MAAGNNSLWHQVCDVVGLPELKQDARYLTPTLRAQNQATLRETLEAVFETEPVAHWLAAFAAAGVPSSPINSYAQALADPQVAHMGWVQEISLPNGKATRTFGSPFRVNGETLPIAAGPPALGEHTEEVLGQVDPEHLGTPMMPV